MEIDVKEINSYSREVTIDVPWTELEQDFLMTVKKFGKKIRLPGFRPGKVPRQILMRQFQPVIEAEFIEDSYPKYYLSALKAKELSPVNQAVVSDVEFKYGKHFSFTAAFEVEPYIEIPVLKRNCLKVQKTIFISDETDINNAIEEIRAAHVEIQTVEDGSQKGDFILGDFQKLDVTGVPIIGEKIEKRFLKIDAHIFSEDNQKKLEGLRPGDKTRLYLPEEDGEESLYEVSIINVERHILPEINEDFVKQIDPGVKNEEEWRLKIKEQIDRHYAQRAKESFERQLSDALIEKINPSCPPSLVDHYLDELITDFKKNNSDVKIDEDKIRARYRSVSERNLKWYLIKKSIIREQNLKVSKEEVQQEIQTLIDQSPEHSKEIEKYYKKPSNRNMIEDDLMEKKVQDYIYGFAKIKTVKVKTKDLRNRTE